MVMSSNPGSGSLINTGLMYMHGPNSYGMEKWRRKDRGMAMPRREALSDSEGRKMEGVE